MGEIKKKKTTARDKGEIVKYMNRLGVELKWPEPLDCLKTYNEDILMEVEPLDGTNQRVLPEEG